MSDLRLRLAHIDGLRALCALWVILYHGYRASFPQPPTLPIVFGWVAWGHFAVPAFLVISGFCLMMPVVRKGELSGGTKYFYWKRVRRILPPYYAAMLLFTLVKHNISKPDFISHLLLLHNFQPQTFYGINASFWSIAVESQIYVVFPLFVVLYLRFGTRIIPPILAAAYIANGALQYTSLWGLCLHYYGLFAIGAASALFAFHQGPRYALWRERCPWLIAALGFCLMLMILTGYVGHPQRIGTDDMTLTSGLQMSVYNLCIALSVACLLVASTAHAGRVKQWLSWPPLVWIGTFSYSIYLIHQPVITILVHFATNHGIPLRLLTPVFLLLFVPVIIIIAYGFHRLFERPFMSPAAKP